MQTTAEQVRRETVPAVDRPESVNHLVVLAVSIFLSAFLLFQVQPLISRWILPWFGGSTAVWTTCMLFFQIVLFGGYGYAHCMFRWLNSRQQCLVHLALLALACGLLPIIPSDAWKPQPGTAPGLAILAMLAATVGLPYFVLSSTGPLLQSWFARSFPGRSPYRLYALSNIGSLLALLSYPIVFEPALDLHTQAWSWSAGFIVLSLTIGLCAWKQSQVPTVGELLVGSPDARSVQREPAPALVRRLAWVALPALASATLLAATNHICQNVAVVPFLWVAPLSLYLVTFIICFDAVHWYRRLPVALVTAVLSFLTAGAVEVDLLRSLPLLAEVALYLAMMFGACLIYHGELVRLRPRAAHLTEFYLAMSAGGALGGVLVSLLAPLVFDGFFEWNLSVLVALATAGAVAAHELRVGSGTAPSARESRLRTLAQRGLIVVCVCGWLVAARWQKGDTDLLTQIRNFYGVISVYETDDVDPTLRRYTFQNGRVDHGQQFRAVEKRTVPLTYYRPESGVGRALVAASQNGPIRVGVVGLGTGTLAAYARPGDVYRFYEINPAAIAVAHEWFTYLDDCQGTVEVAEGDARLLLEQEQHQQFDVLVLDAFSGDSVPVHLLTSEAFEIYAHCIRPGGIIAVNVTNHFLRLATEVEQQADLRGLGHTRLYVEEGEGPGERRSDWMLISSDAEFLQKFPAEVPAEVLADDARQPQAPVWTDRFSNLFRLLKNW
ncbi:MAG: fused MFS/spermidine synthase [Planctomycetes bacterium]|nr:fused MFS/spermidine synthase [Planctomycetota bacterium]